jgi:hypothetical protein
MVILAPVMRLLDRDWRVTVGGRPVEFHGQDASRDRAEQVYTPAGMVPARLERFRAGHGNDCLVAGDPRARAGKIEPRDLAYRAPAAVAADQPVSADRLPARVYQHLVRISGKPSQFRAASNFHAKRRRAIAEHPLDILL